MSSLAVKEVEFVEDRGLRQIHMDRVEVLEKVKKIVTLPNTEVMTTKMVANWYEVSEETIRKTLERNSEELRSNGVISHSGSSLRDIKSLSGLKSRARTITVFSKRALLNIGMLLRDSNVAKQVRSNLLDVHETAPNEVKITPLEKEKELALEILFNETEEDRIVALAKYREFKDRHIKQLETVITKQEPKVRVHDQLMAAVDTVSMIITAKSIGVGEYKLFEFLRATKVLFKEGGDNYPYQRYQNDGHFKVVTSVRQDKYGRDYTLHTTKVTGSGKIFILNLVNKYGGAKVINSLKMKEIKDYVKNYDLK